MPYRRERLTAAIQVCALLAGLMVLAPSRVVGDERDCNQSASRYNMALNDIQYSIGAFQTCVASSRGVSDCSKVFDRLKSADDDFHDAVSSFRSHCK